MDAKKALYRAKLKEAAQKRDKRIDSPLVRYNENDQPICRVCDVVLKSESLWAAHQASRKHHEAIAKLKANAAGQVRTTAKSESPPEFLQKVQSSSTLPADFFDKNGTQRQRTGLPHGDKMDTDALKGSVKHLDSVSSEKVLGKRKGTSVASEEQVASGSQIGREASVDSVNAKGKREIAPPNYVSDTPPNSSISSGKGLLPEGFFDNKGVEATRNMEVSEIKHVNGSLPEGFFDREDAEASRKVDSSEVKQVKGALPEGFFDNKDADLRARGIEPVKVDIKDEYKEFEKLIQEDLHEVDERYGEEEIDAAEVREEEETLEQRACHERVEMWKKKHLELKAARTGGHKSSAMDEDSRDDDSSSDEDDGKENFAVDWRAMHM